nr:band 3 anion transport protein-like [Cherax quadricarinatus]
MDNYIGVGECLLLSCVNGVIFALFAAQPLLIVGATGPLMVFDMSLYQFCQTNEIDFLSMRVWIGIWMTVIGLLVVAVEAIALVRKFTRFIEEIFASLVCIIFVYEAITNMAAIFYDHPLLEVYSCGYYPSNTTSYPNTTMEVGFDNISDMSLLDTVNGSIIDSEDGSIIDSVNGSISVSVNSTIKKAMKKRKMNPQPNTALLSLILMLGTFIIAIKLKYFRNSKYLGRGIRRSLGDFGVPIAIFLMVLLDYLIKDTYTDKLTMPEGIQPSNPAVRGWLINPMGQEKPLPIYCIFAAAPASILVFFLIFLEENICQ